MARLVVLDQIRGHDGASRQPRASHQHPISRRVCPWWSSSWRATTVSLKLKHLLALEHLFYTFYNVQKCNYLNTENQRSHIIGFKSWKVWTCPNFPILALQCKHVLVSFLLSDRWINIWIVDIWWQRVLFMLKMLKCNHSKCVNLRVMTPLHHQLKPLSDCLITQCLVWYDRNVKNHTVKTAL